jgi:thiosulfate dehydrogenase [quinone] large subunit
MSTEDSGWFAGVTLDLSDTWQSYWLVVMRFVAGWWMLHAGLDKVVNWPFDASWFVGGKAAGTSLGPVVTLFDSGLLLEFTNWAVPLGQLAIGLGLIVGVLTRTAAFFGAVLLLFFYFINGETGAWSHGLVTAELLGIVIMGTIVSLGAGGVLAGDEYLKDTEFFRNHPRLQRLLG